MVFAWQALTSWITFINSRVNLVSTFLFQTNTRAYHRRLVEKRHCWGEKIKPRCKDPSGGKSVSCPTGGRMTKMFGFHLQMRVELLYLLLFWDIICPKLIQMLLCSIYFSPCPPGVCYKGDTQSDLPPRRSVLLLKADLRSVGRLNKYEKEELENGWRGILGQ